MIDRPLIYVAGKYRGNIPVNVRRACEVALKLLSFGADVYVPHNNYTMDFIAPQSDEFWLDFTLRMCRRCDAIYRIDGESVGSDAEVAEMVRLGRPVLYTESSAADWIKQWCELHKSGMGRPLPNSEILP